MHAMMPMVNSLMQGNQVLGHNQQQDGSIIQAGARAILIPSDLTRALSSARGRIAAQTIILMGANQKLMNYAALRPFAIMEAIRRHMPEIPHPVLLDPTTGYGAEYIWLAEEFPQATFIEIDRPDVIEDKRQRLRDFKLPSNVILEGVDFRKTTLEAGLRGRRVDMMVVLATYVTPAEFSEALRYFRTVMPKGLTVLAPFTYAPGMQEVQKSGILFRRFASEPSGTVQNHDEVRRVFRDAGYRDLGVYSFAELARDLGKPEPFDIEIIGVGRA